MWGKGARERHRVSVPGDDNPKPSLGNGISPRMLLAGLYEQCWSTELVFSAFPLQGWVDFIISIFICSYTLTKCVPPCADSGNNWGNFAGTGSRNSSLILFKPFPSSWLALPVLHVLDCDKADLEQPHGEQVWEQIQQKRDCLPEAALRAGPLVMHRAVLVPCRKHCQVKAELRFRGGMSTAFLVIKRNPRFQTKHCGFGNWGCGRRDSVPT